MSLVGGNKRQDACEVPSTEGCENASLLLFAAGGETRGKSGRLWEVGGGGPAFPELWGRGGGGTSQVGPRLPCLAPWGPLTDLPRSRKPLSHCGPACRPLA